MGSQFVRWIAACALGTVVGAGVYAVYRGDLHWRSQSPAWTDVAAVPANPEVTAEAAAENPPSAKPNPEPAPASRKEDWLIVPGVRIGKVTADLTYYPPKTLN